MGRICTACCLLLVPAVAVAAAAGKVPTNVAQVAADFDPRAETLQTRVIREWEEDGLVLRHVTFHIGTFKGQAARMAAFYGYPKGGQTMPGLLHLHGGGQRAFLHEVKFYGQRGYACLSINWGGREMERARPDDENTDWGAVDPTQKNVPGYFNLKPGPRYLDATDSPRNNNWYLLTIGARRGLTFLERQPEVSPGRLGVYGHSMGGNLTVYVAGTDNRVQVAAPSVGGQGFRTIPWPLLPAQRKQVPRGDVDLFRATLGFQSYAPHIKAPLLWLGATNDFHGIMDDTYRTGLLIPHANIRYSFALHLNHRFTPEFAVTRPLWIDQHLKGSFKFPRTPASHLTLEKIARLSVTPDASRPVEKVQILYSIDPDPQARFWRTATVVGTANRRTWTAELPLLSTDEPLFAFANVHYRLNQPVPVRSARPTSTFAISSLVHTAAPKALKHNRVQATDRRSLLIDDFSHEFRDWYRLSADNPHHWQFWTRKITDPKWRGPAGHRLTFDVKTRDANRLVVIISENFFRSYQGRQRDLINVVKLPGGDKWHTVSFAPSSLKTVDGKDSMDSWNHADLLGFRAYYGDHRKTTIGTTRWAGPRPEFRNLRWTRPRD